MNSEKLKTKSFRPCGLTARHLRVGLFFALFTFHFSLFTVLAQDDATDLAPPPVKIISKDEKTRLDAETDMKARTKLVILLMETRLFEAEKLNSSEDRDGMFRELGALQGLVDNSLEYLKKFDAADVRVLDNFKRLEIGFRGFMPRLEAIHRDLPLRYEDYVRKLIKFIREARTKALDPLFGDTVVPNKKPEKP